MAKIKSKPFTIVTSSGEKHVFTHKRSLWRAFKRWVRSLWA